MVGRQISWIKILENLLLQAFIRTSWMILDPYFHWMILSAFFEVVSWNYIFVKGWNDSFVRIYFHPTWTKLHKALNWNLQEKVHMLHSILYRYLIRQKYSFQALHFPPSFDGCASNFPKTKVPTLFDIRNFPVMRKINICILNFSRVS